MIVTEEEVCPIPVIPEEQKWIKSYRGQYSIDREANVYSYADPHNPIIVKTWKGMSGEIKITMYKRGIPKKKSLRRLLYCAFVEEVPLHVHIRCKDGNPENVSLDNLVAIEEINYDLVIPSNAAWIPEAYGRYYVTTDGEVFSSYRGRINKLVPFDHGGFPTVYIKVDGRKTTRGVHKLVAEAFLRRRYLENKIVFLNGNKQDCRAENLCWTQEI